MTSRSCRDSYKPSVRAVSTMCLLSPKSAAARHAPNTPGLPLLKRRVYAPVRTLCRQHRDERRKPRMPMITTTDGVDIFYKDWGSGQPIVFSHGWPLSADDWDNQMLFFLDTGYRVVAHDRRGHGRSTQTGDGHDMDHYADDLAAVDRSISISTTRSTSGTRPAAARSCTTSRVTARVAWSKAAIISAVPPLMLQDRRKSRRAAEERVRRSPGRTRRQPVGVLPRAAIGTVLRLQPARRRVVRGDHSRTGGARG